MDLSKISRFDKYYVGFETRTQCMQLRGYICYVYSVVLENSTKSYKCIPSEEVCVCIEKSTLTQKVNTFKFAAGIRMFIQKTINTSFITQVGSLVIYILKIRF